MLDSIQTLLDTFPEGVIQIQNGVILSVNAMAKHYLPQLAPGGPPPAWLILPRGGTAGSGVFTEGPSSYAYSSTRSDGEQIVLFHPAPQSVLTDSQLEGVLRQLRSLLGDILAEVGPATGPSEEKLPADAFGKSFHRLFRLMENLDYMQTAAQGENAGFRSATMDLDGLCRHVTDRAYPLLREAGITLEYESTERSLLIPGSQQLLQRLLLSLIANAAQAVGEGRVVLSLRRQGDRALIAVSDNGPLPAPQQLSALLREGAPEDIPLPGQGAGLGLSIARHITRLHKGSLLVEWGKSTPTVLVALPTGPLDGRISVHTPAVSQTDGGLDPVLTALSDVLPARLFGLEGLD